MKKSVFLIIAAVILASLIGCSKSKWVGLYVGDYMSDTKLAVQLKDDGTFLAYETEGAYAGPEYGNMGTWIEEDDKIILHIPNQDSRAFTKLGNNLVMDGYEFKKVG